MNNVVFVLTSRLRPKQIEKKHMKIVEDTITGPTYSLGKGSTELE